MINITYKHFLMQNKLPDSRDTYWKYLEQYHTQWNKMPEGMKQQTIDVTYKYRFTNYSWAE